MIVISLVVTGVVIYLVNKDQLNEPPIPSIVTGKNKATPIFGNFKWNSKTQENQLNYDSFLATIKPIPVDSTTPIKLEFDKKQNPKHLSYGIIQKMENGWTTNLVRREIKGNTIFPPEEFEVIIIELTAQWSDAQQATYFFSISKDN